MKPLRYHLPAITIAAISAAAVWYGPIPQLADYHDFADKTTHLGIPHFADVLSNLGFALVALWGWFGRATAAPAERRSGWAGYHLFLAALFLTAFGSGWYHLDPDNARLTWDRLPIALVCAGLLAGVWGDTHRRNDGWLTLGLAAFAAFSVGWWHFTELAGAGDLRPYLLLQVAPLVLIPLWQWLHGSPRADRRAFGLALLLYVAAKLAESFDYPIGAALGGLTGHTLKHLLATAAAAVIVHRLIGRAGMRPEEKTNSISGNECVTEIQ
jgi:hypothetical protein